MGHYHPQKKLKQTKCKRAQFLWRAIATLVILCAFGCNELSAASSTSSQAFGQNRSPALSTAEPNPRDAVQAVAQGHPWARVNPNAAVALQAAREAVSSWNKAVADGEGFVDYCDAYRTVRQAYRNDADWTLWGAEVEPIESQYPIAIWTLAALGVHEGLSQKQVDEQAIRKDARYVFVSKIFPSFVQGASNQVVSETDPSQAMYLRYRLADDPDIRPYEFDVQGQRLVSPSHVSIFSDPEDYDAACEHIGTLVAEILHRGSTWPRPTLLDAIGELAFVSAHMIYYEDTNWGVHYAIQVALREVWNLPVRYSWGLDLMMLSIRDINDAADYYKRWSEEDDVSLGIMRYFQLPAHHEQAEEFLAYFAYTDDVRKPCTASAH